MPSGTSFRASRAAVAAGLRIGVFDETWQRFWNPLSRPSCTAPARESGYSCPLNRHLTLPAATSDAAPSTLTDTPQQTIPIARHCPAV